MAQARSIVSGWKSFVSGTHYRHLCRWEELVRYTIRHNWRDIQALCARLWLISQPNVPSRCIILKRWKALHRAGWIPPTMWPCSSVLPMMNHWWMMLMVMIIIDITPPNWCNHTPQIGWVMRDTASQPKESYREPAQILFLLLSQVVSFVGYQYPWCLLANMTRGTSGKVVDQGIRIGWTCWKNTFQFSRCLEFCWCSLGDCLWLGGGNSNSFLECSPRFSGEMIQFDLSIIFQMGWFNWTTKTPAGLTHRTSAINKKPWRRLHGLLEEPWFPIAGTYSCYLKCFTIWHLVAIDDC